MTNYDIHNDDTSAYEEWAGLDYSADHKDRLAIQEDLDIDNALDEEFFKSKVMKN
jgi:hypothetical protein